MAGLGFKDFQVGEVLTSADVDGYLMQQTVMRFADAGARGSALGTATGTAVPLAEGMLSYLDDDNDVEVYDGAEWRRLVLPGTATPVNGSVLQYGTATAEYAPTAGPFPVAIEAGQIPSTGVGVTSGATVSVTFTSGRFATAPYVTTSANTTAGNVVIANARAISSTGFTMQLWNGDASVRDFNSQWIAVEMP